MWFNFFHLKVILLSNAFFASLVNISSLSSPNLAGLYSDITELYYDIFNVVLFFSSLINSFFFLFAISLLIILTIFDPILSVLNIAKKSLNEYINS